MTPITTPTIKEINCNGETILLMPVSEKPTDYDSFIKDGDWHFRLRANKTELVDIVLEKNATGIIYLGFVDSGVVDFDCGSLVKSEMWQSPWDEEVLISVYKSYDDTHDYYEKATDSFLSLIEKEAPEIVIRNKYGEKPEGINYGERENYGSADAAIEFESDLKLWQSEQGRIQKYVVLKIKK